MTKPPLRIAGVLVATSILAAWDGWYAVRAITEHPDANDFRNYYTAATLGTRHGWSMIYDLHLQQEIAAGLGTGWAPFANPPPLAWVVTPFARLPYREADLAWLLLLVAAFLGAWWVAAPGRGLAARVAALTAALGLFPVAFAFVLGQAAVLVAAAVVFAWWLLKREHPIAAGLVLALIVFKPQDALLVPVALLVAGRGRVCVAWCFASALLVIASAVSLGAAGIGQYREALGLLSGLDLGRTYALSGLVGSSWPALLLQVVLGAATLFIARRRRRSVEAVMFVGVVGSFLVAPYLSLQDQVVLVAAAWLLLRERISMLMALLLAAGCVALEFAIPVGGIPLVLVEVGLLAASFHDDEDRRAEQDDPERRKDAAHHRQHHLE